MGGVLSAYIVTTGLIVYRWATQAKQAPPPYALAGEAVIFGLTALLAQRDARFGTATAWAFTIGAALAPDLTKTSPVNFGMTPGGGNGLPRDVPMSPSLA